MQVTKLDAMFKGWFVGNFEPTVYNSDQCEVAVKYYLAGDKEPAHYHKIATEITVIVSGKVRMGDGFYNVGDIVTIAPGETTDFEALEDTVTTVVKLPCAANDKYLVDGDN